MKFLHHWVTFQNWRLYSSQESNFLPFKQIKCTLLFSFPKIYSSFSNCLKCVDQYTQKYHAYKENPSDKTKKFSMKKEWTNQARNIKQSNKFFVFFSLFLVDCLTAKHQKTFSFRRIAQRKKHLYKFIISFKANDGMKHNKFRRQEEIRINNTTSIFFVLKCNFQMKNGL